MRKTLPCLILAPLLLSGCAMFGSPKIPEGYVPDTGFYEVHETGFMIWCYFEGKCKTPPLEIMELNAADACLINQNYRAVQ